MIEIVLFAVTSFLVGLSGALVPGPMLTVTISDSFKKGFIAGPLITSGHIFTELCLVLLILFGLGWLIGSNTASFIIGLLGGIVLIFMGFQIFKETPKLENTSSGEIQDNNSSNREFIKQTSKEYNHESNIISSTDSSNENSSSFRSIINGILTSLSNPFFFIWWATIGGAFIFKGMALAGFLGIFAFLLGHWTSDVAWFSTVSYLSSRSRALVQPDNYRTIMRICGVFMIFVGVYFFINSVGVFKIK
ncbi:MAG: LysE family transporter [Methanobacteriaceae archaeon]|jgi:threonine/homoserine/homoserine lactone efflux protein|nr:LysE family transporter [Methanobacteriaceae archaeon]MDO9627823.1 LysE family transporter [Methanobacteriaceae archaeon]